MCFFAHLHICKYKRRDRPAMLGLSLYFRVFALIKYIILCSWQAFDATELADTSLTRY